MSFLRDFGAGLFTGIGNQLQQREDEERRMQIEEALAKRRLAWQTQMENKINPRQPEPYGVPVQRGPGNWAQPTQQYIPPEFDPETYDVTKPASYVPGPDMPAQDPTALSPKDAAMQDYRERQLAQQRELSEAHTAALGRRTSDRGPAERKPRVRYENGMEIREEPVGTDGWKEYSRRPIWEPNDNTSGNGRAPPKAPTLNPKDREDFLKRAERGSAEDLWRIAETLDLSLPETVTSRRGAEVTDNGWFAADDTSGLDQLRSAVREGIRKYGREPAGKAASGVQAPPDAKPKTAEEAIAALEARYGRKLTDAEKRNVRANFGRL